MPELVFIRHLSFKNYILKHVDPLAEVIKKLRSMRKTFDDTLKIGILFASIDVPELMNAQRNKKVNRQEYGVEGDHKPRNRRSEKSQEFFLKQPSKHRKDDVRNMWEE